jgi:photosystem II stability/assembly factor-like uncharacterized protein
LKKLSLFIFALLLINPVIISQWQTFNIAPSGRFYDVCVVSTDLIWASGDSAKVYRSTNGGLNWQGLGNGLPNFPVLQISAIDQNQAWLNMGTRIFATINGGLNWTEQFYSPVTLINKIHFFNQNTGYLIADQTDSVVGFFITRNGGSNWIRSVNSPVLGSTSTMWINDNGANSLDSNFIWFVAKGSSQVFSRFYKLSGGLNNSWQYYNIGTATSQCSYASFKNSGTGLVTSITYGILITTNGGINWEVRNNSVFADIVRELMIVPGTDWVIQTGIGNVRVSYDLCNNWQPVRTYNSLNFCDAKDTGSIWLAGNRGELLKYNFGFIGINQLSTLIPDKFILYQNYPNPFNPVTKIKFDVPESGNISFKVYDVLGKVIYSLNENKDAGTYEINFNGNDFASGIYYYSIEANGLTDVKKMVLLK